MKYLSVDLETTGLDPEVDQILQFAAVYDNGGELHNLPRFMKYVVLEGCRYSGNIVALAMNRHTIDRLSEIVRTPGWRDAKSLKHSVDYVVGYKQLATEFLSWLSESSQPDSTGKITLASKNCGKMEYQFLRRIPEFQVDKVFHHRFLDPGSLHARLHDEFVPDTAACARRAGVSDHVAHDALADALQQIEIIRAAL